MDALIVTKQIILLKVESRLTSGPGEPNIFPVSNINLECKIASHEKIIQPTPLTHPHSVFIRRTFIKRDLIGLFSSGKTAEVVGGHQHKPAHDESKEEMKNEGGGCAKKYLYTANWPLGNRRVTCCLMLSIRRGRLERKKVHTLTQSEAFVSSSLAAWSHSYGCVEFMSVLGS